MIYVHAFDDVRGKELKMQENDFFSPLKIKKKNCESPQGPRFIAAHESKASKTQVFSAFFF